MSLNKILTTDTSRKPRRRVGRGIGSGLGKTGGRGYKGEGSRTGGKNRGPMFEGGQMPFWMRLPKRGFSNFAHKVTYQPVSLAKVLDVVPGNDITVAAIVAAGLADEGAPIKLTGSKTPGVVADITRKLNIQVHRATASVIAAVEAAGGTVTQLDVQAK